MAFKHTNKELVLIVVFFRYILGTVSLTRSNIAAESILQPFSLETMFDIVEFISSPWMFMLYVRHTVYKLRASHVIHRSLLQRAGGEAGLQADRHVGRNPEWAWNGRQLFYPIHH